MKDNFGGAMMIYILIFFLAIYIVFIALTLNYAQSFRVKNKMIELIEERDGIEDVDDFKSQLIPYLKTLSVPPSRVNIYRVMLDSDVKIKEKCYYAVTSSIDWEWPFLNLKNTWYIRGETKNVEYCKEITITPSDYDAY